MTETETDELELCLLCGNPVSKGIEIEDRDGRIGPAHRSCFRYDRKAAAELPK
jgi:hypothetical protein